MPAVRRPVRDVIQSVLGDIASALPYAHVPTRSRPHIGWYASPGTAVDGCTCAACEAARAGRDLFLGPRQPEAIALAARVADEHATPLAA